MAFPFQARIAAALQRAGRGLAPSPPPRKRAENWGWGSGFSGPVGITPVGQEGASQAPRLYPWRPNRQHINTILAAEGGILRARTRQLIANTAYGSNASDTFVAYASGTGIKPSSLIENQDQKGALQQAFNDWTDEADADGLTDFYGLQSLVARACFDAGECFVRVRSRYASDGLTVPMQLQLLEAEQLDETYSEQLANGGRIRCGIEFDRIGRRVAYWFWQQHPGDFTTTTYTMERTRVPAQSVFHIYKPLRPGQIRGRPWLAPAMVKMHDLDQYDDFELARKKGAALFMGFLKTGLASEAQVDKVLTGETQADLDANYANRVGTWLANYMSMEPSVLQALPDGFDIQFSNPADVGPNYESFQIRQLYALCAAMGLPYHAVTGDVSKANYSSLRASLIEVRRRIEQFQWETLIYQFCRQVWRAWVPQAVLAGAVKLPGFARNQTEMMRVKWITPRWDWVDPLKDQQAEKLAVDSGFKARSDVIEANGEDPVETDERIAADLQREEELGLSFAVGFSTRADQPTGQSDVQSAETQTQEAAEVPPAQPATPPQPKRAA